MTSKPSKNCPSSQEDSLVELTHAHVGVVPVGLTRLKPRRLIRPLGVGMAAAPSPARARRWVGDRRAVLRAALDATQALRGHEPVGDASRHRLAITQQMLPLVSYDIDAAIALPHTLDEFEKGVVAFRTRRTLDRSGSRTSYAVRARTSVPNRCVRNVARSAHSRKVQPTATPAGFKLYDCAVDSNSERDSLAEHFA